MKQRKHKPQPEKRIFIAAMEQYSNHSPKPLQRLRHALNQFELVKRGIRQPDIGSGTRQKPHTLKELVDMPATSAVNQPVRYHHSENESEGRKHLARYRKMVAAVALVSSY